MMKQPVQGDCPKCPSDRVLLWYQHPYKRDYDEGCVQESRKSRDNRATERERYRKAVDLYESLPWWRRMFSERPRRSVPLFPDEDYTPSERWYLGDEWDAEHHLVRCSSCGYEWREHVA